MRTATLKVTIVCSSPELKKLYGSTLRSIDAQCTWQSSLRELIETGKTAAPSVIILDLDSESEPIQLFSGELRALFPSAEWIALSNQDSAQTAVGCLRAGFSDFLVKPMNPGELAWAVLRCQQRRQAREEWARSPTRLLEAVKEMAACSSVTLLRITSLQFLQQTLHCARIHWVARNRKSLHVEQSIPRMETKARKFDPSAFGKLSRSQWKYIPSKKALWIPSRVFTGEGILAVGLKTKPDAETLKEARSLVEHLDLSHANLSRHEQLRQQTFLDDLTGLFNARYLRHCLERAVTEHKERRQPFCVLFIDVDRFKSVNDTHGHIVGSQLLKALGRSLKNLVRPQDYVFRYGGDEFVVLLRESQLTRAMQIAERVRRSVERRLFLIEGLSLKATLSIGVAGYPAHAQTLDVLLKMADQAMYDAKRKSRNSVQTRPTEISA